MGKILICLALGLLCLDLAECRNFKIDTEKVEYSAINCRKHSAVLTDFGGKGDGKTSNTDAFKAAIANLSKVSSDGGALLVVPPGKWLTGSFDLISYFTLYIHKDAVLLASQEESDYPLIDPLPSYGRGRDAAGKRDVIIEYLTIIAPVDSPNTDGINPDSCTNTRIRDSFVVSGDDCIAVKSGWDEYGIKFGKPTQHLSIKRFTCISPDSAVIALGSEMSGGIQDVRAEEIYALNSQSGVRIKTAPGRGAYVKDIYVRNLNFDTIKYVFWMTGAYGSHPDDGYDPNALPQVTNINFKDVFAKNVTYVGDLSGIQGDPFTGICISNVTAEVATKKKSVNLYENAKKKVKLPWNCTDIGGVSSRVSPTPCDLLPEKQVDCAFPGDTLPIDTVVLKTCSVGV
ncbi:hypothetical protein DH2020_009901 [Rehmannia glutinosa]|uniref:Polygalacturonase n=1 Tax=Rehmannia glutinosa TaxID=99300 RepID=A0ABR0X7L3_REHGL